MSKAIQGLGMIAGAIGIGAAMFFMASTGVGFAALPFMMHAMEALAIGGLSMEAGAAASALTSQRGSGITLRQTAAYRQIRRGMFRGAGVEIWRSTTGGTNRQLNYVVVVAGHVCAAICDIYLDGRKVYWQGSGVGWAYGPDGTGFGGFADGNSHEGPNGVQYNFGGLVYCEAKYGTQVSGDVIGGLTANDPNWAAGPDGNPYVGGCTYFYLKVEGDQTEFPSEPEIKITTRGKMLFDPRSGETAYTANWALHVADAISDPTYGLGDPFVNLEQLIAAANVCDEQIPLASGGTESQWCLHWNYDTSMSPGNALVTMMEAAGGRCRQIGGEWFIFPAYWQGPSLSFDHGNLAGGIQWNPNAGIDKLVNMVTGTYIAPNFPYNVAGNLYDTNGFYEGQTQNNFNFAYQATNAPQYSRDAPHGYAVNADLNADSGVQGPWSSTQSYNEGDVVSYNGTLWVSLRDLNLNNVPATPSGAEIASQMPWAPGSLYLPMDMQLQTVTSVTQAQRLFKLEYMRRRFFGKGQLPMMLAAYQMQSLDVMTFTSPEMGWMGKVLEIDQPVLRSVEVRTPGMSAEQQGESAMQVLVPVSETDPSIYEWQVAEENTVYGLQAIPGAQVT